MKISALILVGAAFIIFSVPTAYADEKTCESSDFWNAVANECSPHTVDTDTRNGNKAGGGADVVLWQSDKSEPLIEEVLAEYRYDGRNKNSQIYGVVRVNLWNKVKGLFNR